MITIPSTTFWAWNSPHGGRLTGVSLVFLSVIILGGFLKSNAVKAEPFIPDNDGYVLEVLPESLIPSTGGDMNDVAALEKRMAQYPDNPDLLEQLVRRYIELERKTVDQRYLSFAETLLRPWFNKETPAPMIVYVLQARIDQRLHRYEPALGHLSKITPTSIYSIEAISLRAAIHLAQGRFAEMYVDCRQMAQTGEMVLSINCFAQIYGYTGRAALMYERLSAILENVARSDAEKQEVLITLGNLASVMGEVGNAVKHYKQALTINPENTYVKNMLAEIYLQTGEKEALKNLIVGTVPDNGILIKAVIAEKRYGRMFAASNFEKDLERSFDSQRLRENVLISREYARYLLDIKDQPEDALEVALQNWLHQREAEDTLLLMRAAKASGRVNTVNTVITWLRDTGFDDVRINKVKNELPAAKNAS